MTGCVCRGTLARQQAAEYGNMQTGSRKSDLLYYYYYYHYHYHYYYYYHYHYHYYYYYYYYHYYYYHYYYYYYYYYYIQEHMLLAGSPKLDRSKGRGQTNVDHLSKRLNGFA
nr:hypothetical protein BaRGS_034776 [Batillaria attramentaria]